MTTEEKIEYWVANNDLTPVELALLEMIRQLQAEVQGLQELEGVA